MIKDVKGKKVTVIGGAKSGISTAVLLKKKGAQVFVSEKKQKIDSVFLEKLKKYGIDYETGGHSKNCYDADIIVLSSSVSPMDEPVLKAKDMRIPIIGELDLCCLFIDAPVIAVTGTNGKSTTATLTHLILKEAGYNSALAGNIGTPVADVCDLDADVVVLEVSSYQLYWAKSYFSPLLSAIVSIAPDHLDWHGGYNEYKKAKYKILGLTKEFVLIPSICFGDPLLRGYDLSRVVVVGENEVGSKSIKGFLSYKDNVCIWNDFITGKQVVLFEGDVVNLLGKHNFINCCYAALLSYLFGANVDAIVSAISKFNGLPHRTQKVKEIEGVLYVDDSKGTNVSSTVAALKSLSGKKVVILGGRGKGEDYSPLAEAVKEEARFAVLIGEEGVNISAALDRVGFREYCFASDMYDAVVKAQKKALRGDVVLLSPACASFDMFKNYAERGNIFKEIVENLER